MSRSEGKEASVGSNDNYSSGEERDGRFYGPDNSWRYYTKAERELASSLDQIENNDLSAHLYNAHRLKRSLYGNPDLKPWHSKQRWISRDEAGHVPFHPDREWTAWPLDPVDVPRSSEQWGVPAAGEDDDASTYRRRENWAPGSHLRDCMHAEIQRQATQRFRARSGAGSDGSSPRPSCRVPNDSTEQDSDDSAQAERNTKSVDDKCWPVPIADDEIAISIARPAVCHIITKLDDVLRGLHRSRQGHCRTRSHSHTGAGLERARSGSVTEVQDSPHSQRSPSPKQPSRASSRQERRQRHKLGTRDWSEVLGVASLVGWDPAVVARAAQRCAALFDESMEFRAMPAMWEDSTAVHGLRSACGTESSPPKVNSDAGFPCQHTSCSRHCEPYSHLWRLREHLKRKHKHDTHQVHTMIGEADRRMTLSKVSNRLLGGDDEGKHEEYLQPVLINIGRSTDKRVRRRPSRQHLRKGAEFQQQHEDTSGSEGAAV